MTGWRQDSFGSDVTHGLPIRFTFDGEPVWGLQGDTVASALLAAGVRVVGRSFKYHRPRGIWGMGAEEPNAIVDVSIDGITTPNQRATLVPLREGMAVRSVNAAPNAASDRNALIDLAHRFLPAGFYYKTFMALGWMRWEPMIRRMAGLGQLDPNHVPAAEAPLIHGHADLLVVGAGPAGLAAARAAAEAGRRVWLVDDARQAGGALRWRGGEIDGQTWQAWSKATLALVRAAGGKVLLDTTLWGAMDHGHFSAWQRRSGGDALWQIRAGEVILAAGAIERPMWFANNDKPGVMSAEAAYHHLSLYGAVAGRQVVLGCASDAAYPVADALQAAGADVIIADARSDLPKSQHRQIPGAQITAARGRKSVWGADINGSFINADTVLCAGGWTPTVHLWCQAGGKLDWDAARDMLVPRPGTAPMQVVGAANGAMGLSAALAEGHAAAKGAGRAPRSSDNLAWSGLALRPDPGLRGRQWIDLQNDVTLKDVSLAAREGYRSVEHLKRYTTLGMATDQGRTSNFAGLAAMSAITGRSIPETGTTTYRPPFQPVPLSLIAGRQQSALMHPVSRLALEPQHRAAGAQFREYGGWLRPSAYGAGDDQALAQAEAAMARQTAGLFDASSLGKIEVMGPNAAAMLDFTGYMRMSTLKPGRARYGFMLSETGVVYDDGVVLRLDDHRFIVSASSSHTSGVRYRLEDARQDRFGGKGAFVHDVTSAWVTLTVSGPRARDLIAAAGIVLPDLPHMGVVETRWCDQPMRAARISFTGDLSFELSVPTPQGPGLRDALDQARRAVGAVWIGLEAVMILRAEKGFILIGKDTDGNTLPQDLGWPGPRMKRQDEYLGKRSLFTPTGALQTRRQLVGLRVDGAPLTVGSHFVEQPGATRSLGFVTSSYFSPTLDRPIALGLLESGRARIGGTVQCYHDGELRVAQVTPACALDPKGERLNA